MKPHQTGVNGLFINDELELAAVSYEFHQLTRQRLQIGQNCAWHATQVALTRIRTPVLWIKRNLNGFMFRFSVNGITEGSLVLKTHTAPKTVLLYVVQR